MFIGVILITSRSRTQSPNSEDGSVLNSTSVDRSDPVAISQDSENFYSRGQRGSDVSTIRSILDAVGTHRVRKLELDYLADMASLDRSNLSPSRISYY